MAEGKRTLTIKFKPEGDKALISAIKKLANAQRSLESITKKHAKTLKTHRMRVERNTVAVNKLQSVIGIYRNKMLLASFAISIVSKGLVSFVQKAGEQEDSVRRLSMVFGNDAAKALDEFSSKLQQASVYGDESINVVMGQIGAFGATEEQTKALTQATVDLSAGLGIDLNTAGLLVAKTFGTSTDALTRYGVGAMGATEQSEKFENIIGSINEKFGGLGEALSRTTSGQLALAKNAVGDFAEEIGKVLAPAILLAARALKAIAQALNSSKIKAAGIIITGLTIIFYANRLASIAAARGLGVYTGATRLLSLASKGLKNSLKMLRIAMASNPWTAAAVAVLALGTAIAEWMGVFDEADDTMEGFGNTIKSAGDKAMEWRAEVNANKKALQEKIDMLRATTEVEKEAIRQGRELTDSEEDLVHQIVAVTEALQQEKTLTDLVNQAYGSQLQVKKDILSQQIEDLKMKFLEEGENKKLGEAIRVLETRMVGYDEAIKRSTTANYEKIETEKKLTERFAEQEKTLRKRLIVEGRQVIGLRELSEVQKLQLKYGDDLKGLDESQRDAILDHAAAIDIINSRLKKNNELSEVKQEIAIASRDLILDIAEAEAEKARQEAETKIEEIDRVEQHELESLRATAEYKAASDKEKKKMEEKITKENDKARQKARSKANEDLRKAFYVDQASRLAEVYMSTAAAVSKAVAISPITGGLPWSAIAGTIGGIQAAMILSQKPPRMQYGGLVGGNRHSAGGTMVEAERGEFVISRPGVEAMGVEALNKINMGMTGSAGSSVTINNPLLGKDTIEDEIVPQIKEALRRGGDIGL